MPPHRRLEIVPDGPEFVATFGSVFIARGSSKEDALDRARERMTAPREDDGGIQELMDRDRE